MFNSMFSRGLSSLAVLGLLASQSSAVITSGAPSKTGIQSRREIRDLMNDQPSWYLFIQALNQIYAISQSNSTGYYQIAGIHGEPQVAYDGVTGVSDPDTPGYCTHSSNLFTTWHRPYLALLEQQLVAAAQSIALQYPSAVQAQYVAAANNLRLPYFDWAANPGSSGVWVANFSVATIQVVTPAGNQSISNPLYRYTFSPTPTALDAPWNSWNYTLRYPSSNKANAGSNNAKCASSINAGQPNWHDRVYNLLTQNYQYNQFSNDQCTQQSCTDSVEGVHNDIHNSIGGGNTNGHMTWPMVAAFDPTFWLHHCMVDRLFALWQVSNNQTWFQPQTQSPGTFWYADQYVSKSTTPLKPFKQVGTTFWTSDTVRDWTKFQYTYPELPQGLGTDPKSVRSAVNRLYGSVTTTTTTSTSSTSKSTSSSSSSSSSSSTSAVTTTSKSSSSTSSTSSSSSSSTPTSTSTSSSSSTTSSSTTSSTTTSSTSTTTSTSTSTSTSSSTSTTSSSSSTDPGTSSSSSSTDTSTPTTSSSSSTTSSTPTPGSRRLLRWRRSLEKMEKREKKEKKEGKVEKKKEYTIPGTSSKIREYIAKVRAQKNALGQAYSVFFFLGSYPSDPSLWVLSDNFIGSNSFLTKKMSPSEAAKAKPLIVGAAVPLNRALLKKADAGEINSLEDDDEVEKYLMVILHWEVQPADGSVLVKDSVPNLLISVVSNQIEPATSITEYPKRVGKTKTHVGITKKKPAGLGAPPA